MLRSQLAEITTALPINFICPVEMENQKYNLFGESSKHVVKLQSEKVAQAR